MPRSRPPQRPRVAPPARAASPSNAKVDALECFAVAAPGLEALVAEELSALGIRGTVVAGGGGVSWQGGASSLMLANLWLRTASRVVVRIAEFRARSFFELERHARRIPWERFVRPDG